MDRTVPVFFFFAYTLTIRALHSVQISARTRNSLACTPRQMRLCRDPGRGHRQTDTQAGAPYSNSKLDEGFHKSPPPITVHYIVHPQAVEPAARVLQDLSVRCFNSRNAGVSSRTPDGDLGAVKWYLFEG